MATNSAPSNPPAAPDATPMTCPSCHAPLAAGVRFCGQCGAAVPAPGAGASPPGPAPVGGPAPPVDLRQKVDADRGAIKKLQLLIPGYRGYRLGEDIRDADSLLRRQVADKLVAGLAQLQQVRQNLTTQNQYTSLTDLALILSDLNVLEGSIRHAEQGYTGISAPIRVGPEQLDRLYEYDYGFALAADQLRNEIAPLGAAAQANDVARIRSEVDRLRGLVAQLRSAFQVRMQSIEGVRV